MHTVRADALAGQQLWSALQKQHREMIVLKVTAGGSNVVFADQTTSVASGH